jgi:predicted DNA-binding WGR domain protein
MNQVRSTKLFFRGGKSDKVYEVALYDLGSHCGKARYLVNFRYGRQGGKLREGTKTKMPVALEEANKLFDSLVVSKINKGYQPADDDNPPDCAPPAITHSTTDNPNNPHDIRNARLFFRSGKSDKVYEVDLCDLGSHHGKARYLINFRYGRRGGRLYEGTKTKTPVALEEANKLFNSLVASKIDKGYQLADGDNPADSTLPAMALSNTGNPNNSRNWIILGRLAAAQQKRLPSGEVKRVVWRAGELALYPAAALIGQLAGQDDDLLDYCIAWSLGRCGDTSLLPVLDTLRQRYGKHYVSAMAREAQLALLDQAGREVMQGQIRAALPSFLSNTIKTAQVSEILSALKLLVNDPSGETIDTLIDLYALALDNSALHQALWQLIPLLKPVPNRFKAIRRLFKMAEFRQDAKVYGAITRLLDVTSPYFRSPKYSDYAMEPVFKRYLSVTKEYKKRTPAFAYSDRTRDYLRRRCWRTLRQLASLDLEQYVAHAVEILLAVNDTDARPEQVIRYYDHAQRSYVSHTCDRYSHLFAFNHILNLNNPHLRLSGSGKYWLRDTSVSEVADFRCEAYPELWDRSPQALLRLLTESYCDVVHTFAVRALKCNQDFVRNIGSEATRRMLTMPYEATARFALEIAQRLLRSGFRNSELIAALLQSPINEGHALAQETLHLYPEMLTGNTDLAYIVITSQHENNRLWMRRFVADHPFPEAMVTSLVARLIAGAIVLGAEHESHRLIIKDITWILINSFTKVTQQLSFDVISDLLDEKSDAVQLLGAQLLLNHGMPVETLPPSLLRRLLEAKSADVRALGTQLLGRLSDEVLLAQPALVLKLALSQDAQVRQAAQTIIDRLAKSNPAFASLALERLIDSLFRSEPVDGFHDDILQLIKESLTTREQSIDTDTNWRLLQARSKGAQRYGAHLLKRRTGGEFSVRQLGRLAGNPILSVRQWAWARYEQQVDRIKGNAQDALVIFDTQWEETRRFAIDFFNRHFGADDWNPELLVHICDSTLDDIQDYGRQLIMRFFDEQQGVNYLLKLSQHPANNVQLFVSQFLHQYAADNIENLVKLRHYFMTVLGKVNQARVAKDRVTGFLHTEALKSPEAARFVLDIYSRHSVTSAIVDKAASIEMLLSISERYPELDSPLNMIGVRKYPGQKKLQEAC